MLIHGDARHIPLADGVAQCVVTSPPFFGLRSYGIGAENGEIGLESTPEEYVAHIVQVFREVKRVCRDDAVVFLNLGDSYGTGGSGQNFLASAGSTANSTVEIAGGYGHIKQKPLKGMHKQLLGIPWRVAFALQAEGWYLRQDCIWAKGVSGQQQIWNNAYNAALKEGLDEVVAKRIADAVDPYVGNPMPESVKDRCTKSHEYIFLLTKSARYYYDNEAIKEPNQGDGRKRGPNNHAVSADNRGAGNGHSGLLGGTPHLDSGGRNRRSVWTIPTKSYSGSHFAVMPEALVEPCILAGTSEKGCCPKCGKPWERVVETTRTFESGSGKSGRDPIGKNGAGMQGGGATGDIRRGPCVHSVTTGWRPTCDCDAGEPVPCLVLDPFAGSGTVGAVCAKYGRSFVGLDLNMGYLSELATERIGEAEEAALLEQRQPTLFEGAR